MSLFDTIRAKSMSPEAAYADGKRLLNEKKSRAFPYLKHAAEQGHARAQRALGACYKNGLGCREDLCKTLYWYEKAAHQGIYRAQYETAQIYELGRGVRADKKKALYWYEKAAETGKRGDWLYVHVLFVCSLCYEEGRGCEVDLEKALYWQFKHYEVLAEDLKEAIEKGRDGSIEIVLDSVVKSLETIRRLKTQLGIAGDEELKLISDLHLSRALKLEKGIEDRLDNVNCQPTDISVDNLVKHLEAVRQIRIQLGLMDPEEHLISKTLNRLFEVASAQLHEEMILHGTSATANKLYLKVKELYKKIRFYIPQVDLPQIARDLLSTRN